ncbi:MAG: hypothetical protein AAGE03_13165 [Pseudomonadota bacterium]
MGHLTPAVSNHPTIGIVCGLTSEVRCAERALGPLRDRAVIVASGASSARAADQAADLLADGVAALVSFGLAGALDPALKAGEVVKAGRVVGAAGTFGAGDRTVWGSDQVVAGPSQKAELYARTGAVIVDMESEAVAMAALRAGLPFLVLRAVSDDAGTELPDYLAEAVRPNGSPNLPAVLKGLMGKPSSLPTLIRLGRNTKRALTALDRAARIELPALLRRLDVS